MTQDHEVDTAPLTVTVDVATPRTKTQEEDYHKNRLSRIPLEGGKCFDPLQRLSEVWSSLVKTRKRSWGKEQLSAVELLCSHDDFTLRHETNPTNSQYVKISFLFSLIVPKTIS